MQHQINILVVDDFVTMRKITTTFLRELGYSRIEQADDGLTALPLLKTGDFDFLITDWNMPGMDGLALVKAVRSDPDLADLPVLMVSSEAREDHIRMAAAADVNGYIVKPFTRPVLRAHIEQVLRPHAAA